MHTHERCVLSESQAAAPWPKRRHASVRAPALTAFGRPLRPCALGHSADLPKVLSQNAVAWVLASGVARSSVIALPLGGPLAFYT